MTSAPVTGTVTIPANHPALPGHFPGAPVVPGVLLLEAAIRLATNTGPGPISGVASTKFRATVLPDEVVTLTLTEGPRGLSVTGRVADKTVFQAVLRRSP